MTDFTPEPVHVDNWRDHANWSGPACRECGHPLWAPQSVAGKLCASCAQDVFPGYEGPPYLLQYKDLGDRREATGDGRRTGAVPQRRVTEPIG